MRQTRLKFSELTTRLTGFSTPVFGMSWTPPVNECNVAKRLVVFLEDRRVLFADYCMEYGPWVDQSVLEIRKELTELLSACPESQTLGGAIRAMRAACRKFLDTSNTAARGRFHFLEPERWQALGELRAVIGLHLARLCLAYGIDLEPQLASILPAQDNEELRDNHSPRGHEHRQTPTNTD